MRFHTRLNWTTLTVQVDKFTQPDCPSRKQLAVVGLCLHSTRLYNMMYDVLIYLFPIHPFSTTYPGSGRGGRYVMLQMLFILYINHERLKSGEAKTH